MAKILALSIQLKAEQLSKVLTSFQAANFRDLHASIGEDVLNVIRDRFDKSRDPNGRKWPKIKRYFNRAANRWRNPSDPPLKLLDLYQSFSYNATEEQVEVGTPKVYAKYHTDFPTNNGNPRKVIPLREFMGLSLGDIEDLLDTVEDYIDKVLPPSDSPATAGA